MSIPDDLLLRGEDAHRPSLENLIAQRSDLCADTLGYRNAYQREHALLGWATDCLLDVDRPATVVDIGTAYGNLLLMLNARLERDCQVNLLGIDLDERALAFGRAFSTAVAGYSNCQFLVHDVTATLPLEDRSVDLVLAADIIEHLPDVRATLQEVRRVLRPSGRLILSTPLAQSLFKRLAALVNRVSGGSVNRAYYRGKGAELDDRGRPIMAVHAGHDHVSEMTYGELIETLSACGFYVQRQKLGPVMSGSCWFDQHPTLLSALIALEALHSRLGRPSWAHGIVLDAKVAG